MVFDKNEVGFRVIANDDGQVVGFMLMAKRNASYHAVQFCQTFLRSFLESQSKIYIRNNPDKEPRIFFRHSAYHQQNTCHFELSSEAAEALKALSTKCDGAVIKDPGPGFKIYVNSALV